MSDIIEHIPSRFKNVTREGKNTQAMWFADMANDAQQRWNASEFPTRKTEDWRYTSLALLNKTPFFSGEKSTESAYQYRECNIPGMDAYTLVYVNGSLSVAHSDIEPLNAVNGVSIIRYAEANTAQQDIIKQHTNTTLDTEKHIFSSLNLGQLDDGLLIHVAENVQVDKPIHIISYVFSDKDPCSVNLRNLVVLDKGAELDLVEHFLNGDDDHASLMNQTSEFVIGDNAQLNHYRLNEESGEHIHFGGIHTKLARSARVNSFYMAFGSALKRFDVGVVHAGEGADACINGIYLPHDKQHIDFHTCIEHTVAHCQSSETFRGIVADQAKAVFNGRIHIHRHAQKTDAFLSNKNLLTSNKAEVDTKPELEIYADDVRCAHGATVAQLDENATHYLRTRGIEAEEAKMMLSFGFINALLSDMKREEISDYLRPKIAQMFAQKNSSAGSAM